MPESPEFKMVGASEMIPFDVARSSHYDLVTPKANDGDLEVERVAYADVQAKLEEAVTDHLRRTVKPMSEVIRDTMVSLLNRTMQPRIPLTPEQVSVLLKDGDVIVTFPYTLPAMIRIDLPMNHREVVNREDLND